MIEYKEFLRSEERVKKGQEILKEILPDLKKKYPPDYYVAIETGSGDYFVGERNDVYHKARQKYPDTIFYVSRLSGPIRVPFLRGGLV